MSMAFSSIRALDLPTEEDTRFDPHPVRKVGGPEPTRGHLEVGLREVRPFPALLQPVAGMLSASPEP